MGVASSIMEQTHAHDAQTGGLEVGFEHRNDIQADASIIGRVPRALSIDICLNRNRGEEHGTSRIA